MNVGKRVVVLAGPTAVGKSALALRLCDVLQGEIVSVDSVQVYRGLQIGAAKPSAEEQARVPHHLLDLQDPDEEYTAGAFYKDALQTVEKILARGRLPVLVGGTSMYMRWLARGRPEAPKADPVLNEQVRDMLEPMEAANDWTRGLAELTKLDPARAEQLSRNDWYRLQRAIVVARQTATTAADLGPPPDPDGLDALRESLDMRCFFLCAPREPLCRRIDQRCDAMLQQGLLEETTSELLRGHLLPSSPAGRAIGYRQTLQYLTRRDWKKNDASSLREYITLFTGATRKYAREQTKWFRNEPSFQFVPANWASPQATEAAVLKHVQCDRREWEAALADASQAELRALDPNADKVMKTYVPTLPSLDEPERLEGLLRRADECRLQLEPRLAELLEADDAMAARFPWHSNTAERDKATDDGAEGSKSPPAKVAKTEQGGRPQREGA